MSYLSWSFVGLLALFLLGHGSGPVTVTRYGALGNGAHDDAPNIQAAINAHVGAIYLPAGTYRSCATLILRPGVYLVGQDASLLACAANQVQASLTFGWATMAHAGITGMTFDGNGQDGVLGFTCVYCQDFRLQGNTFIGENPFLFDRGGQAVFIDQNLNRGDYVVHGAGTATLTSSTDTDYNFGTEISGYTVHNTGNGLSGPGLRFRRVVGLNASHVAINDAWVGPEPQTSIIFENDCQGDRVSDSILGSGIAGVMLWTGTGVQVAPSFITLSNVDVDQQTLAAGLLFSGYYVSIHGGKITSSGAANSANGILVQSGSFVQISDMQFNGFLTGAAINLVDGTDFSIHDNLIQNTMVGVGFPGPARRADVHGNIFSGVFAPIAGQVGANLIHDNTGMLPSNSAALLHSR